MRYTLADYATNIKENVTFGTCDLCMSTRDMTEQFFHIKDETGQTHIIPGFHWEWRDLYEIHIENIPHFAQWLSHQDIDPPFAGTDYDYAWLDMVVRQYDCDQRKPADIAWAENHVTIGGTQVRFRFDSPVPEEAVDLEMWIVHADPGDTLNLRSSHLYEVPRDRIYLDAGLEAGDDTFFEIESHPDGKIYMRVDPISTRTDNSTLVPLGECPCEVVLDFSHQGMLPEVQVEPIA